MKSNKKPIVAAFVLVIIVAAIVASCTSQKVLQPSFDPELSTQEDTTAEPETTPATPYASTTHENDYLEDSHPCPTDCPEPPFTYDDTIMVAKTVWGEARGCTPEEQRLVVWTILQRVDADNWANTIEGVVTQKRQFAGYKESNPIDADIYALCLTELTDWWHGAEPPTHEIYAPTAPYFFFDGDGRNNWFREEWR